MSILSERIKELRESKNISQTELGKQVGVGKTTISNYETGYSSPDNETLSRIADVLDTTTDYLLGRKGSQNSGNKKNVLNNLKIVMGNSSPKKFAESINDPRITEDLLKAYIKEEISPQIGNLFIIAEAIGIDYNFFYMANNTYEALEIAKESYKVNPSRNLYGDKSDEYTRLINKIKDNYLDVKSIEGIIDIMISQKNKS